MITEHDRIEREKKEVESRVEYLNDVIKKSARYERLLVNQDFKDVLKDLEEAASEAARQIDIHTRFKYTAEDPVEREKFDNIISNYVIRLIQIEEYINRPEKVVAFANTCREELSRLKSMKKGVPHA